MHIPGLSFTTVAKQLQQELSMALSQLAAAGSRPLSIFAFVPFTRPRQKVFKPTVTSLLVILGLVMSCKANLSLIINNN